ncbi:MAG TPA: hypothetical protein VHM01_05030, partial [Alphaproteobacteria bacterium]|nr:hypothetical protein [Alphaproteobacteria bacterium]
WPALAGERTLSSHASGHDHPLLACWHGEMPDEARIVIATAAIALRLLGRAGSSDEADELARRMWKARDSSRYPHATAATMPRAAAG